jgi:hypothetical protein
MPLVARQQKILHPDRIEGTRLKMFEPQGSGMYSPPSSDSKALNGRKFCEFHDSPLYNSIQQDIWQRIHNAIHSALSLHHRVDISCLTKEFNLEFHLEQMSQVLKTNHVPIIEPDHFAADAFTGPLPVDTPCPGTFSSSFAC